jgi:hypothetical protein
MHYRFLVKAMTLPDFYLDEIIRFRDDADPDKVVRIAYKTDLPKAVYRGVQK